MAGKIRRVLDTWTVDILVSENPKLNKYKASVSRIVPSRLLRSDK